MRRRLEGSKQKVYSLSRFAKLPRHVLVTFHKACIVRVVFQWRQLLAKRQDLQVFVHRYICIEMECRSEATTVAATG